MAAGPVINQTVPGCGEASSRVPKGEPLWREGQPGSAAPAEAAAKGEAVQSDTLWHVLRSLTCL